MPIGISHFPVRDDDIVTEQRIVLKQVNHLCTKPQSDGSAQREAKTTSSQEVDHGEGDEAYLSRFIPDSYSEIQKEKVPRSESV